MSPHTNSTRISCRTPSRIPLAYSRTFPNTYVLPTVLQYSTSFVRFLNPEGYRMLWTRTRSHSFHFWFFDRSFDWLVMRRGFVLTIFRTAFTTMGSVYQLRAWPSSWVSSDHGVGFSVHVHHDASWWVSTEIHHHRWKCFTCHSSRLVHTFLISRFTIVIITFNCITLLILSNSNHFNNDDERKQQRQEQPQHPQ